MNGFATRRLLAGLVIATCLGTTVGRAQSRLAATPSDWRLEFTTAVYADQDVAWTVRHGRATAATSACAWSIDVAGRTLARGAAAWSEAKEGEARAALAWRAPPVRDGEVVEARLHLSVDAGRRVDDETSVPIAVFPRDPFASRRKWLQSLAAQALVPDDVARRSLDAWPEAFRRVRGASEVERLAPGVLVVFGVGASADRRAPGPAIGEYVRRGGRCLWVAPPAGARVATFGGETDAWEAVDWRRSAVIATFDKRLDAGFWRGTEGERFGVLPTERRDAERRRERFWESTDEPGAWPWLDARGAGGGRLIVCGLPLFDDWERAPTPKFWFARVLESLAGTPGDVAAP